jgi:hypothetical protein
VWGNCAREKCMDGVYWWECRSIVAARWDVRQWRIEGKAGVYRARAGAGEVLDS